MPKVYISGPITGVENYKDNFRKAAYHVSRYNGIAVNPCEIEPGCEGKCTDKEEAYNDGGHTYECYLRYDLIAMLQCDEVYFLRGWEESRGAQIEMSVASNCGLELRYQEEEEPK